MEELSNWDRRGKTDQLGTVNLINPAKRTQALALVKTGVSVLLARDVDKAAARTTPIRSATGWCIRGKSRGTGAL